MITASQFPRRIANSLIILCLFCLILPFLIGCSNGEVAIARKDLREFKTYIEKNGDTIGIKEFFDAKRKENFAVWERLAEKGVPEGKFLLGLCYKWGLGVEEDEEKAMKLIGDAARQG